MASAVQIGMKVDRLRDCAVVAAVAADVLEAGGLSMTAATATSDLLRGNNQLARTY